MNFYRCGPNALLLHFADKPGDWAFQKCRALVTELEEHPPAGLVDFTPAYTNILLEFDVSASKELEQLGKRLIGQLEAAAKGKLPLGSIKEIPVTYKGPDLERVADFNKISLEQLVKYHTDPIYKVYFLGFSPGFPYLGDLHHRLRTPRLASPRAKVAAGSVAIGGDQTGVYTIDSPGGWNIIGHTKIKLFAPERARAGSEEDAFFLRQGDRVRFVLD